jgi:hypothetical protein
MMSDNLSAIEHYREMALSGMTIEEAAQVRSVQVVSIKHIMRSNGYYSWNVLGNKKRKVLKVSPCYKEYEGLSIDQILSQAFTAVVGYDPEKAEGRKDA